MPILHAKNSYDGSLERLTDMIVASAESGDLSTFTSLLERHFLAAWFGIRPERLAQFAEAAIAADCDPHGAARSLLAFVGAAPEDRHIAMVSGASKQLTQLAAQTGRILDLRLRGLADESGPLLDELQESLRAGNPLFDTHRGWRLMTAVQSGITAVLAGDFARALILFSVAEAHPLLPELAFLSRDARVKTALVQALLGDPRLARRALERAMQLPRTSSWAEAHIDAHAALAEMLLSLHDGHDIDQASLVLDGVDLRDVGEMWPFYAITSYHLLERGGLRGELTARISTLESMPFPRIPGRAFVGSVFPLIKSAIQLNRGNTTAARRLLDDADPSCIATQLLVLQLELASGRPGRAIKAAEQVRKNPAGAGLRLVELKRFSALASAYLALGQTAEAAEALNSLVELWGPRPDDRGVFSSEVNSFAESSIDGWPMGSATDRSDPAGDAGAANPDLSPGLTDREFEILRLLRSDSSRTEIALLLFITENTLKAHLRKIYRKLGVSSRAAALLRAEREGWLP